MGTLLHRTNLVKQILREAGFGPVLLLAFSELRNKADETDTISFLVPQIFEYSKVYWVKSLLDEDRLCEN